VHSHTCNSACCELLWLSPASADRGAVNAGVHGRYARNRMIVPRRSAPPKIRSLDDARLSIVGPLMIRVFDDPIHEDPLRGEPLRRDVSWTSAPAGASAEAGLQPPGNISDLVHAHRVLHRVA